MGPRGEGGAAVGGLLGPLEGVEFTIRRRYEASWTDPDHPIVAATAMACERVIGAPVARNMRVGASDARLYRAAGIPAVVCGLAPHNLGGTDEYAEVLELPAVAKIHALAALAFLDDQAPRRHREGVEDAKRNAGYDTTTGWAGRPRSQDTPCPGKGCKGTRRNTVNDTNDTAGKPVLGNPRAAADVNKLDRRIKRFEFSWSWFSIPSLILVWIVTATQFPSYILPQVWDVAEEGYEWVVSGDIWPHLQGSFLEIVGGFGLAIVISLACGFLAGFYKGFREYIVPLNGLFMAIPPIAWAPLMLIVFGIGYTTIILVVLISAVNPMILTIMEGVLQITGQEVRAARVLGARRWQLLVYVYLPASLPFVTAALRIGFSQAWRALVAAEMIGAAAGVGWMVQVGGEIGNARQVLLGIALIGGFSYLFERLLFRPIEKRYEVWRLA